MTVGLLNFINALAGSLAFLSWAVITIRAVQFIFMDPALGTTIIPPKAGQAQHVYKRDRLILLSAVGVLLFCEFILDARSVYGRHTGLWVETYWLAYIGWGGKAIASLVIARQFSVVRCGEKGWITMLLFAVAFSFFAF